MSEDTTKTDETNKNAAATGGDSNAETLRATVDKIKQANVSDEFVEFAEHAVNALSEVEEAYTKLAAERDELSTKLAEAEKNLETAKKASTEGTPAETVKVSEEVVASITDQVKQAYSLNEVDTKAFSEAVRGDPEYVAKYLDKILKSSTAQPTGQGIDSDAQSSSEFFSKDAAAQDTDDDDTRKKLAAVLREGAN